MKIHTLLFALGLTAAGAVRADPMPGEVAHGARIPASKIGISLGLGGGASGFTATEMADVAKVGGTYELRSTIGTRLPLAAEIAYVGSWREISLSGVSSGSGESPHIFSNGIEGTARLQFPYVTGNWMIEPFAFGGLGWSHIGVDGTVATGSAIGTADGILVVPFGGGVAASWNGILLEGRFTYRATYDEDLLKKSDGSTASLANWSVGGLVGYEF